jgi:parvulin-like peptidyl-prolyl isomerase
MNAINWRGWFTALVVATMAGPMWAQAPATEERPAAVVNGDAITMAEVDAVVRLMPSSGPAPATAAAAESDRMARQREALEMLVDDVLMRQFLSQHGRRVEPKEIDHKLAELENALKAQKRTLADFLKDTAQSQAHLRQDVVKKLQWDDFIARQLTEPNLKKYYDENKDFYDQATVRASHIWLRVPPTAGTAECDRARSSLLELRQKIVSGQMDFAEAAKRYSQCESAPRGGDIGYFPRKWAVDENIARAAFALQVGQVSDVVHSDYGFHLIQVTDRKPGHPSDYAKMHDEVRENFGMELWHSVLTQQRRGAQIEMNVPWARPSTGH